MSIKDADWANYNSIALKNVSINADHICIAIVVASAVGNLFYIICHFFLK